MPDDVLLLPWHDHATSLGGATDGLEVHSWAEGEEAPSTDVLERVTFYVPQYLGGRSALEAMTRMPSLRTVQSLWAGVDAVWPFLPDGVALHNAAGVHDASTAELAVGLALARLRGLDEFARNQTTGSWLPRRNDAIADKRVLILGFGRIGQAIEQRLAGFECEVVRVARSARTLDDGRHVQAMSELPDLLPTVDVVILIVPATEETVGLVDSGFLALMRPGALLVNVARGPVVVTDDLVAALHDGRVRAALDVTDPEPLPADHPLWSAPGVLISPHIGGNSSAFEPRARRLVAAQIRRLRAGEPLDNLVARP
ncbi:2-hydroxyacid dehydrogenase [Longivirga aurantiaca]|uniref:2-hydroxyacid dehydrogenase n=1 Tax=Longivirga aurantiaca TaxID=1837743 RepID=A0ABW1SZS7_9ACTN